MTTYPQVTIDVLDRGDGYSVARITGNKMPFLILCPTAIADLGRLFEAAALRSRALADSQAADAIAEFQRSFKAVLSKYDTATETYGAILSEPTDPEEAYQRFIDELSALRQLGEPPKENDLFPRGT